MDLAAELADRKLRIQVTISASSTHILLYECLGPDKAATRVPNDAELFARIEAEIERLLEGCDE